MFPYSHVIYCNPKLKLSGMTLTLNPEIPVDLKKYNARKKEAIRRTQNLIDGEHIHLIENVDEQGTLNTSPKPLHSIGFFDSFKKKDDIADAILNGYVFIIEKKM